MFRGVVFECPCCGTLLAGERTGNANRFPNACPNCGVGLEVTETSSNTSGYLLVLLTQTPRLFIRKPFTRVKEGC